MSSLKNIREKFGISQQQVAHWLGISRSLAAHYESGIRSLPTHALLQLAKLEIVLAEFEKNVSGDTKHSDKNVSCDTNHGDDLPVGDDAAVPLHPKLAFQLDKAERLQQQLWVLQSRHAVLQQQMLLIKKMMDSGNGQTGEKEKLWLQMLYYGLCCKISKFDESKQLPLRGKILEMRKNN